MGDKGYEPDVLHWWRTCCGSARKAVEVGANIGYFTVHGAKNNPDLEYLAVEPHPANAALLRRHLDLNKLGEVEVVEAAVVGSETSSTVELHVPKADHYGFPSGGFLTHGLRNMPSRDTILVATVSARQLFPGADLIKIDAEGSEYDILSSVVDILFYSMPIIFVEMLDGNDNLRRLVEELAQAKYQMLVPVGGQLMPISPSRLGQTSILKTFGHRDVVLAPDGRFEGLGLR